MLSISKQAFSQARRKISPKAFIKMVDEINKWFYKDTPFKTYHGYRLLAIDGTVLELPNTEELRQVYGYIENQNAQVARARASALYDLENDMIISSQITHYRCGEREIAEGLIEDMFKLDACNDLILFDRGYPSRDFIKFLESKNLKYLMRVRGKFLKPVMAAPMGDTVIAVEYEGINLRMRILKFKLNSDVVETLVTNLVDDNLSIGEFKELYFKRWGIEVKYNEIKNRLQIENFTGEMPIAIEQDFYATMYLSNLVSLAKKDANQGIKEKCKGKNLKYEYKVNTNVLIGKLKHKLILIMIERRPRKRSKMLKDIEEQISKNVIPIRPNRNFERKENKSTQMENRMNKKRAL